MSQINSKSSTQGGRGITFNEIRRKGFWVINENTTVNITVFNMQEVNTKLECTNDE